MLSSIFMESIAMQTKAVKLIAHRGNLSGPNSIAENTLSTITNCLVQGFDVEIDVRLQHGNLYLGHDQPQEEVSIDFLKTYSAKLWIHCKCVDSLNQLLTYKELNCFYHDIDDCTLTSHNYIWTFPRKRTTERSVIVAANFEETMSNLLADIYGICTDFGGCI